MGFGHLTRCLALSQAFLEKGYVSSFIVHGDDSIQSVLQDVEYEKCQWLNGIEELRTRLQNAFLIIDSLSISEDLLEEVSGLTKVIILDDFIRREHHDSIIIDWTINAENKFYTHRDPSSHYLLGHEYISLRNPFWGSTKFFVKPAIENVLITFGGGDVRNLTPRVLDILKNNYPSVMKTIIIGGGYRNRATIEEKADNMTTIYSDTSAETMMSCMADADVVIASGGQTLYELACVGAPTISIMLIDNQLDDIDGWEESGFTCHAGSWDDIDLENNILSCLHSLEPIGARQSKSAIGQDIVDGQGARRIVSTVLEKLHDC